MAAVAPLPDPGLGVLSHLGLRALVFQDQADARSTRSAGKSLQIIRTANGAREQLPLPKIWQVRRWLGLSCGHQQAV